QAGAVLRPRPVEFLLVDILAGPLQFGKNDRYELGYVAPAGGGMDAENAGVRKAPMEGVDRITQAALFPQLLKEAGGHAAAEDHRQDLRSVEIAHVIGAALEAEDDLRIHQVALFAEVAAHVMRILRQG